MEIKVEGGGLETALKILKRKLQKDGLMGDLKKRRFYEKPSLKLKTKQRQARKRRERSARWKRQSQ